jgi:hypothetical protein
VRPLLAQQRAPPALEAARRAGADADPSALMAAIGQALHDAGATVGGGVPGSPAA